MRRFRRLRKSAVWALPVIIWILLCVWWQWGFLWALRTATYSLLLAGILALVIKLVPALIRVMGIGAAAGIMVGLILAFWTGIRPLSFYTVASFLLFIAFWLWSRISGRKLGWMFSFLAWILCSLYSYVADRHFELHDPARFQRITRRYPSLRIGVALSGGGYRAALLHAGVLSGLEDLHLVPTNISSVSGGSIIAAFYTLGGKPEDLLRAVQGGRFNLKRELVLLQNLVRLPFPAQVPGTSLRLLPGYQFGRTAVQADLLDRVLLRGKTFTDLKQAGLPSLMLDATDLGTGEAVGITRRGSFSTLTLSPLQGVAPRQGYLGSLFAYFPQPLPSALELTHFPEQERIANIVAASGAFPLAFPPLVRDIRIQDDPDNPKQVHHRLLRLADGGITDNSGLSLILVAESAGTHTFDPRETNEVFEDWHTDLIIASDASSIFSTKRPEEVSFDPTRAIDIIYARVQMEYPRFQRHTYPLPEPKIIPLSPQSMVSYPLNKEQQPDIYIHVLGNEPPIYLDDEGFSAALFEFPSQRDGLLRVRQTEREAMIKQAAGKPIQPRTNADAEADTLISRKMEEDIRTFLATATLDDQIPSENAVRIYNLGRYLTFIRFHEIEEAAKSRLDLRARMALAGTSSSSTGSGR